MHFNSLLFLMYSLPLFGSDSTGPTSLATPPSSVHNSFSSLHCYALLHARPMGRGKPFPLPPIVPGAPAGPGPHACTVKGCLKHLNTSQHAWKDKERQEDREQFQSLHYKFVRYRLSFSCKLILDKQSCNRGDKWQKPCIEAHKEAQNALFPNAHIHWQLSWC